MNTCRWELSQILSQIQRLSWVLRWEKIPEVVGANVTDKTGNEHLGIIEFPVPILKGNVKISILHSLSIQTH